MRHVDETVLAFHGREAQKQRDIERQDKVTPGYWKGLEAGKAELAGRRRKSLGYTLGKQAAIRQHQKERIAQGRAELAAKAQERKSKLQVQSYEDETPKEELLMSSKKYSVDFWRMALDDLRKEVSKGTSWLMAVGKVAHSWQVAPSVIVKFLIRHKLLEKFKRGKATETDILRAVAMLSGSQEEFDAYIKDNLDEAISGSAWMFYNHYNPDLLNALQRVLIGEKVDDVVNSMFNLSEAVPRNVLMKAYKAKATPRLFTPKMLKRGSKNITPASATTPIHKLAKAMTPASDRARKLLRTSWLQ